MFSHGFFEKPSKITVNPLTMQVVVVFKEFVKFFIFSYSRIKTLYTLKIKNVTEARYVGTGEKIVICTSDGIVHLMDSYTFVSVPLLDFYGEVAEVQMIDQHQLFLKNNKNTLYLYRQQHNAK